MLVPTIKIDEVYMTRLHINNICKTNPTHAANHGVQARHPDHLNQLQQWSDLHLGKPGPNSLDLQCQQGDQDFSYLIHFEVFQAIEQVRVAGGLQWPIRGHCALKTFPKLLLLLLPHTDLVSSSEFLKGGWMVHFVWKWPLQNGERTM